MGGAGKSYAHGTSIEARFRVKAEARKWKVYRAGWPDFLLTAEGKIEFVEVKSIGDVLSDGQIEMFAALEQAGVAVKIWWEYDPDVLIGWRSFHAATGPKKDPPPKLAPVKPRKPRGPWRPYNPRALGTLERDFKRGIGNSLKNWKK